VCKNNKKLVIIVTHNQALKDIADKVISIKNGKIESVVINENPKPIEEIEW
jgi:putative ABC transport system ATP-binding protein